MIYQFSSFIICHWSCLSLVTIFHGTFSFAFIILICHFHVSFSLIICHYFETFSCFTDHHWLSCIIMYPCFSPPSSAVLSSCRTCPEEWPTQQALSPWKADNCYQNNATWWYMIITDDNWWWMIIHDGGWWWVEINDDTL